MVRVDLDMFVKALSAFFERVKPPSQKTLESWFDEVYQIPTHHIPEILAAAKLLDNWPRNLPVFMKIKSREISETSGEKRSHSIHPRRINPERYARPDCSKCAGRGVYRFPMDWPKSKINGVIITRPFSPRVLCECTAASDPGA